MADTKKPKPNILSGNPSSKCTRCGGTTVRAVNSNVSTCTRCGSKSSSVKI